MEQQTKRAGRDRTKLKPAMAADVAQLAGVSVSAVSRTFTAGASVSERTRKKILDAARTLKYRPAQASRTIASKGSRVIGIAMSDLESQFYPRMLQQLSDALASAGYRLLLFMTHGDTHLDPVPAELLRFRVDALVLASTSRSFPLADRCRDFGIPVIMFNNVSATSQTVSIAGANFLGARTLGSFLIAGGHRRLAFMAGVEDSSTTLERGAGFQSVVAEHGLPQPLQVCGEYSFAGAVKATQELFSKRVRPDAVFCANDHMATVCIQVARAEFGLEPGRDVSIVGFDDIDIAAWPAFSLTTYSQPMERMVARTVQVLRKLLDGESFDGVHESVRGELIVRGSARCPEAGIEVRANGTRVWTGKI